MSRYLLAGILSLGFLYNGQSQTVCPPDTIGYTIEKSTQFDTLTLDPFFTGAVYQYFDAPQLLTISGARFYAYKANQTGGNSMQVVVDLVRATNDNLPSSLIYASDTVTLSVKDSANVPFDSLFIDATWPAVAIQDNYCVVIKSISSNPEMTFFHNKIDGINSDGQQEFFSGVRQGLSWIQGNNYQPTGEPFDADFMILPFVSYTMQASFLNDPECLFDELGETVNFFNEGSKIADHRMYNRYAFYNVAQGQFWNFGDGSPVFYQIDPSHFYPTNGPYVATMTSKILSWSNKVCQSSRTQIIKERPSQDFSFTSDNLDVTFTNKTVGQYTSISYTFGDSNYSVSPNPNHTYAKPGTYWVCQTMMTSCGEIKQCKNVAVATNTSLNCGKDSVRYIAARGTEAKSMSLKNTSPKRLLGIGLSFDTPQSLIVHGFTFYANHFGLFRDAYPVSCNIYRKVSGSLPDEVPLATSTVRINKFEVDTLYSDTTRYNAIFNKPVNLKKGEDYVLTIEYDSNFPIQIVTTDWTSNDGEGNFNAIGKINDSTWVTAASVGLFSPPGNDPFDAEPILEPLVEYNFDANFTYDFECIRELPGTYSFENLSSPITGSKVYNKLVFDSTLVSGYVWDFGDSTGLINQVNGFHNFQGTGPFDVKMNIIMNGWTNDCFSTQTLNVPVRPTGGFGSEILNTSVVQFSDSSVNADEYLWTFQDNTISTLSSPIHYFTSIGTFQVCQYVSNVCGSDTICDSVVINVVGIPEREIQDIQIFPNPSKEFISINGQNQSGNELEISILDLSGRTVKSINFSNGIANKEWYVGDLARGTYLIRLRSGDYEGVRKHLLY